MTALRKIILGVAAGVLLLFLAPPIPAQTTLAPTELAHRMARHFPEKPPAHFEILRTAEHEPRIVITNLYQHPLTALIVRTDPTAANAITNTLVFDALTRMGFFAPIPTGLSFVTGMPHIVGQPVPDSVLAAAVWEDGSTYGPDDLLARISSHRSALADIYDRAIAMLQTGLDKNWTAAEYTAAAQQLQQPKNAAQPATPGETSLDSIPIRTIAVNMDHATQGNRPAKRTALIARNLLAHFTQDRDALRAALTEPTSPADSPSR